MTEPEDSIETRRMTPLPGPGLRLGGCVLESRLGQGGMGTVWEARQLSLDRVVAVKLIDPALATDVGFMERFKREAKAVGKLNHRNVVAIHDAGVDRGLGYIVMERLQGWSLQERLEKRGALSEAEALDLLAQSARGLAAAHGAGLVHRDMKPGNVFLCTDGTVKILDFGLARDASSSITQAGERLGTPHYMSPEGCEGKAVTERSDLYSLGATAYAAIAGLPPFRAETPVALLRKHVEEKPKPLEKVHNATNDLVLALLAKEPGHRPATAAHVADLAQAILGGKPIPRLRPPINLKPVAYACLTGVILLFGIVTAKILIAGPRMKVVPGSTERAHTFSTFKAAVAPDGMGRGILEVTLAPKPGAGLCGVLGDTKGHKHRKGEFGINLSADTAIELDTREVLHEELREPKTFRVPFKVSVSGQHRIYVHIRYQAVLLDSEEADSFDLGKVDIELKVVVD